MTIKISIDVLPKAKSAIIAKKYVFLPLLGSFIQVCHWNFKGGLAKEALLVNPGNT
jgi:hypothetical protein